MGDILTDAQGTLARADTLLRSIQQWADNERISHTLNNMEQASKEARLLLAENRRDLRLAVQHLEDFSRRLASIKTIRPSSLGSARKGKSFRSIPLGITTVRLESG